MTPSPQLATVQTGERVMLPGFGLVLLVNQHPSAPGQPERWLITVDHHATANNQMPPGVDALGDHLRLLTDYEAPTLEAARQAIADTLPLMKAAAETITQARAAAMTGMERIRQAVDDRPGLSE